MFQLCATKCADHAQPSAPEYRNPLYTYPVPVSRQTFSFPIPYLTNPSHNTVPYEGDGTGLLLKDFNGRGESSLVWNKAFDGGRGIHMAVSGDRLHLFLDLASVLQLLMDLLYHYFSHYT